VARISFDDYFMNIAVAVRMRANCLGRRVGAVITQDNRIISTGYNGTPQGMTNCLAGGCVRCRDKSAFAPSVGYDVCICVHAEQNALIAAARFGHPIEGAVVYSTMRPCFECTKAMLQAKVDSICYLHDWAHPQGGDLQEQYLVAQDKIPNKVRRIVDFIDPHADWANGKTDVAPRLAVG
jgi:dCMP deaminase